MPFGDAGRGLAPQDQRDAVHDESRGRWRYRPHVQTLFLALARDRRSLHPPRFGHEAGDFLADAVMVVGERDEFEDELAVDGAGEILPDRLDRLLGRDVLLEPR